MINKELFQERIAEAKNLMETTNKAGVLVVLQSPVPGENIVLFPQVRESISNVLIFVEIGNPDVIPEFFDYIDDLFYAIVIDIDRKNDRSEQFIRCWKQHAFGIRTFYFSDYSIWGSAAADFLKMLLPEAKDPILLCGDDLLSYHTGVHLLEYGFDLLLPDGSGLVKAWSVPEMPYSSQILPCTRDNLARTAAVAGCRAMERSVPFDLCKMLPDAGIAYDVGIGNFSPEAIRYLRNANYKIYRHDNRAGISTLVTRLLETDYLINQVMGEVTLGGVNIAAGGIMGRDGAIIVDNINTPSYIVGVADGVGHLKTGPLSEQERKDRSFIEEMLASDAVSE